MTQLIAVVDDEETLRETVGFALRREGYRVEPFPDGLAAWRSFERGLPDLAILDILMPGPSGSSGTRPPPCSTAGAGCEAGSAARGEGTRSATSRAPSRS